MAKNKITIAAAIPLAILALVLLTLRVLLWHVGDGNYDMRTAYLVWQTYLIEHGRWHAMRQPIGMYFPAYYDLTTLTSYLDGQFNRVTQIKLVSFCFDILAAAVAYNLVGRLTRDDSSKGPTVAQLAAGLLIGASLLEYSEYFAPFPEKTAARHVVLFVAFLANTAALWLVFQRIMLRVRRAKLAEGLT